MTGSSRLKTTELLAKRRILFITGQIKEPHGSALSAIDVLRSIPCSYQKYILTEHPIPRGSYLYGAIPLSFYPPAAKFRSNRVSRRIWQLFASIYLVTVLFWLKISKFDLVVVNGYGSSYLWPKVNKIISASTVTTVISRESPRHFDFGDSNHTLSNQIEFLRSFSSHIFVSSALRDEWISLASLDIRRAHYLPNCCDEQSFLTLNRNSIAESPIRRKYGISANIPIILNVGTIELRKGQQDLEYLARNLRNKRLDFRIACIGYEASEDGSMFRKRIQSSQLCRYFIFPGASDQMYSWYQAATMLAFTSRAEAMPRTVLEAMASALPIVSTNVDGIPELIEHLKDGYLYCPGDLQKLIMGTEWILNNPSKARNLGSNARDKYLRSFSQEKHALRMKIVIRMLIDQEIHVE
jgi:glycosyltransferase involved in cell wall biosynthesis